MSIFGNILHKLFPKNTPGATSAQGPSATSTAPATSGVPQPVPSTPASGQSASTPASTPAQTPAQTPAAAAVAPPTAAAVDVEAVLNGLAAHNPQKLNWRTSIVDLMKLLDLDSSLKNRQDLAKELHYTGNMDDSAAMNIWLHKQVMTQLAANGGKVPKELMD